MEKKGTWTCIARNNNTGDTAAKTMGHRTLAEAMSDAKKILRACLPAIGSKYTLIAWETTETDIHHHHPYIH